MGSQNRVERTKKKVKTKDKPDTVSVGKMGFLGTHKIQIIKKTLLTKQLVQGSSIKSKILSTQGGHEKQEEHKGDEKNEEKGGGQARKVP